MDFEKEFLGGNSIEDASWVCSLSESELDLLISLKMMVLQRAKVIGHEDLAKKFNLRMLRVLGVILMEYLKGHIKDLSLPGVAGSAAFMDGSNLLKCDEEVLMTMEEIKACLNTKSFSRESTKRQRKE